MATDTATPRSRRAVLAAAAGAAAAVVASTLGRAAPVRAADGDAVIAGADNQSSVPTTVTMTPDPDRRSGAAVAGMTSYGGSAGLGVGIGVSGTNGSTSANPDGAWGVYGESQHGIGVRGRGETGVMGVTGFNGSISDYWVPKQRADTGVVGHVVESSDTTDSAGVYGHAFHGTGVHGVGNTGVLGDARQVIGTAAVGKGVAGLATAGTGVYGEATAATGYALRTKGRLKFDGSSGIATILAGNRSVTVKPGVLLSTQSAVLATLLAAAGGTTTVHRCRVDVASNTFTIFLTKESIVKVPVAWLVVG
jgi:hypothetical protein